MNKTLGILLTVLAAASCVVFCVGMGALAIREVDFSKVDPLRLTIGLSIFVGAVSAIAATFFNYLGRDE